MNDIKFLNTHGPYVNLYGTYVNLYQKSPFLRLRVGLDEKIVLELFLKKQPAVTTPQESLELVIPSFFVGPLKYPNNIEKITRVQILLPGSPSNTSPTTAHPNEEQYGGGSTLLATRVYYAVVRASLKLVSLPL